MRDKPRVCKHGGKWECWMGNTVWGFETWWQSLCCATVLASGQVPWMFASHIGRPSEEVNI